MHTQVYFNNYARQVIQPFEYKCYNSCSIYFFMVTLNYFDSTDKTGVYSLVNYG